MTHSLVNLIQLGELGASEWHLTNFVDGNLWVKNSAETGHPFTRNATDLLPVDGE